MAQALARLPRPSVGGGSLTKWMWTWVTVGILVVLVVVGFLIGIVSALESIDDNLAEADTAVRGAGGDVKPLPGHIADVNASLTDIDTALKPIPAQADTIVESLASIEKTFLSIDPSLKDTSGTLSRKATTDRSADTVSAAGYDNNFVLDFHPSISTASNRRAAINYNCLPCYPITRTRRQQHGHARDLLRFANASQRVKCLCFGQSLRVLPQSAREISSH